MAYSTNLNFSKEIECVYKEEAQECLTNLTNWAKSDKPLLGKTLGEWIFYRKEAHSEERIDEIFKQIEQKTGICRKALCSNKAMRGNYYEARKYAAKLLRSELNLSDYEIGKLLGISATTVNLYLEVCADWYSGDHTEVREKQYKMLSK
jgi:chromosomal replication initiation ATPase DnaA